MRFHPLSIIKPRAAFIPGKRDSFSFPGTATRGFVFICNCSTPLKIDEKRRRGLSAQMFCRQYPGLSVIFTNQMSSIFCMHPSAGQEGIAAMRGSSRYLSIVSCVTIAPSPTPR